MSRLAPTSDITVLTHDVSGPHHSVRSLLVRSAVVAGLAAASAVVGLVSAIPASADTGGTTLLMGVGGSAVTDASGQVWSSGRGFTGGRLITPPAAGTVIKNTSDQALYLTAMFGFTGWTAPVANGSYTVTLRMMDPWYGGANQRLFSVTAEGKPALTNVDIAKNVGMFAAYDQTFPVTVSDGSLSLGFSASRSAATVSAIAVKPSSVPAAGAPSTPATTTPPPSSATTNAPKGSVAYVGVAAPPASGAPATPAPTTGTPTTGTPTTGTPTTGTPTTGTPTTGTPTTGTPTTGTPTTGTPTTGAAMPGPTNTGVPAGTVLTRLDGDQIFNTAGATYQNLDIHGRVKIMAPNITIKNSIIRGNASRIPGSIVGCGERGDHSNFLLVDSEIVPEFPNWSQDGILGNNYTVLRSNIHGTTDAVKVAGDNVTVRDSWLHDTYNVMSDNGTNTHNDGVQSVGGSNLTIVHNTITGNDNAGMMLGSAAANITNVTFTDNYVDGGGCSVNIAINRFPTIDPVTISNNVFGSGQRLAKCAVIANLARTPVVSTGNTWAANGLPIMISRGA